MDRQPFHVSDNPPACPAMTGGIRAGTCTIDDQVVFLRDLRAIAAGSKTHIICFNADMMAGRIHVSTAMIHAIRAFESGTMISNSLEMEALLFAAGSRQCSMATSFGIHGGMNHLFVCCYPERQGIWNALGTMIRFCEDFPGVIDPEKKCLLGKIFGISEAETDAAGGAERFLDLVLERIALLEVSR